MRRSMTLLAVAALLSLAVAGVAVAHTARSETTVTAKVKKGGKDEGTFSGTVGSMVGRCLGNRTVEVFRREANPPDTFIGTDLTDTAGAWELPPASELLPGTYYAVASKKVLKKNRKHRHICRRGQSADIAVK